MTETGFDSARTPLKTRRPRPRSALMIAIRDAVDGWTLTQAEAAKRLGVTQPRMNDLLRGRIDKFSLDALMVRATAD